MNAIEGVWLVAAIVATVSSSFQEVGCNGQGTPCEVYVVNRECDAERRVPLASANDPKSAHLCSLLILSVGSYTDFEI